MIIVWLRLAGVILIGSTLIYVLLSIYYRSVERERLEKDWDTDPLRDGLPADERDAYIETGMDAYRHSLRRRLIWLVYIVPLVAISVIVYAVN
jgi:hypothetical protein